MRIKANRHTQTNKINKPVPTTCRQEEKNSQYREINSDLFLLKNLIIFLFGKFECFAFFQFQDNMALSLCTTETAEKES